MSFPQSNIDWSKYMKGLEGKANTDLNNVTKLSGDFISKLMPNYSKRINKNWDTVYTADKNLMLMIFIGSQQADCFLEVDGVSFLISDATISGTFGNATTFFIKKGSTYKVVRGSTYKSDYLYEIPLGDN